MHASAARRGYSIVELLVALVLLVSITGVTFAVFRSQSESFRRNTARFDLAQNMRSAIELTERTIRTMGAGVTGTQPVLVYGGPDVIAFNSDYVERDTVEIRWAAYWNPDAASAETRAWSTATAGVLPNTSYTYPTANFTLGNGTPSPAETWILWFALDNTTSRTDDYTLFQRVNGGTPEILARGLLAPTGSRPFFEYLLQRGTLGAETLSPPLATEVPLIRRPLTGALTAADTAARVRPDSVRAVRLRFRVTNGRQGAEQLIRDVETVIETPNNGIPMPVVCGRSPLEPDALTIVDPGLGDGVLNIEWSASTDQAAGEQDVRQYILWRRRATQSAFGEPLLVVRAEPGLATYQTEITDNDPGTAYVFGVAAQDCTPAMSSVRTRTVTTSTP